MKNSIKQLATQSTFFGILHRYLPVFVLLLLSFVIVWHSFQPGMYKTHDGEIHIIRSMHFFEELLRGQLPVRIVPAQAYGYGYMVFNFFYPLPYYVTAIFQLLGFGTVTSWKLMQALVTGASLLAMYGWLRSQMKVLPALVGSIVYALVPFRLLTLYVTGQIGGYYSLVWAPLIAWGLHKLIAENKKASGGTLVALGVGGMITSHLLSVIVFALPLFGYGAVLLWQHFSWQKVRELVLSVVLGIGLSAFYVLPFLTEKSWVKLGHAILVDYSQHWPTLRQLIYSPWGYGHSNPGPADGMSFQVGLGVWIALVVTTFLILQHAVLILKQKRKQELKIDSTVGIAIMFSIVTLVLVLLMTTFSSAVWDIVVPLQLIQYPWRMLAATSCIGSWLAGWVVSRFTGRIRWVVASVLVTIALYNARNYLRPSLTDWQTESSYRQDQSAFYGPADISWELMPVTATEIPTFVPDLVIEASRSGVHIISAQRESGNARARIELEAVQSTEITVQIWNLPVWKAVVNDAIVGIKTAEDGTMLIPVGAGESTIELYVQQTQVEKVSTLLTLLSACGLVWYWRSRR